MKATTQTEPHSVGHIEGYKLFPGSFIIHGNEFERQYEIFCEENKLDRDSYDSMDAYYCSLKPTEQIEVID